LKSGRNPSSAAAFVRFTDASVAAKTAAIEMFVFIV
jgi:hypothetical protein